MLREHKGVHPSCMLPAFPSHLGSARVSERDEKEETTDVVLLF